MSIQTIISTRSIIGLSLASTLFISSLASAPAHAHRAWILPEVATVAGDSPMVTFDAAISNSIFVADYHAFRTDGLTAYAPNGETVELENVHRGRFRTSFDLSLADSGTYRIASASQGLSGRWEAEDGSRRMFPGRGQSFDDAAFHNEVPQDAANLQVSYVSRRIETFVTAGAPSEESVAPTNKGLEARYLTHPNDLFAGENADIQFLIDGEPAVGAEVTVIQGGMRYRNLQNELTLQTDSDGMVSIAWAGAGKYWLEATYSDDRASAPATTRRGSYVATFEVLPE